MKTKILLLVGVMLSLAAKLQAQHFWENTYPDMDAQTVLETDDGGFIVCSAENSDMAVYKLDYLGNPEWKRGLGGFHEGRVVRQTLDGGYIAVGRGNYLNERCLAIAKLDASGNVVWGKRQDLHEVFEARDVIQLPDSSYIVCAAGGDNSGYDLSGLLRYDKNGNLLWHKSYRTCSQSGCHPKLNSLLDNGNGEFFAFGQYYTNPSSRGGWIIKFDSLGNIMTQAKMGMDINQSIKTSDGNIVVIGVASSNACLMKLNPSTLNGIWMKSYSVDLPWVGASTSWGCSVLEDSNSDLVLYAVTSENVTRSIVIKTNSSGTATEWYGMDNFNVGTYNQWEARMSKTSDNGYILGYRDRIKKLPEDLSVACDLLSVTVTTNNLSTPVPSTVSPTLYTTNNVLGSISSGVFATPTATQVCSTYVCSPVTSTDVQSACSSYVWIDGNTYTSSNNTATHTITGGAANGCDSIITLDLTIGDFQAPVPDVSNLADVNSECEIVSLTAPTATDDCAGPITGTTTTPLPISSSTTITWTYDDGNGNTSTQTQNIVIADVTPPVADIGTLADINDECEVTPTAPTATDNCSGAITGTPDVTFPITASGTTTIIWTYDDGNGNTSTQTQDVIITPIDVSTTTTANANDYTITANASGYNYQWIEDCGNNNTPVSGANNQSYTPTSNGNYAVIIDNGNCSDTSDCVIIADLGIATNDFGDEFKVYPNPTLGDLKIDLGHSYPEGKIKVLNTIGQVVLETSFKGKQELNIHLDGRLGIYLLEISTPDGKTARVNVIKK